MKRKSKETEKSEEVCRRKSVGVPEARRGRGGLEGRHFLASPLGSGLLFLSVSSSASSCSFSAERSVSSLDRTWGTVGSGLGSGFRFRFGFGFGFGFRFGFRFGFGFGFRFGFGFG